MHLALITSMSISLYSTHIIPLALGSPEEVAVVLVGVRDPDHLALLPPAPGGQHPVLREHAPVDGHVGHGGQSEAPEGLDAPAQLLAPPPGDAAQHEEVEALLLRGLKEVRGKGV